MSTTNAYCEALGIQVPRVEVARHSPDANYYSLLIVALLERGEPITLQEAAKRLEEAGVAPADRALASLKRCRPARPPLYRDGDLYALDPHDHAAVRVRDDGLWELDREHDAVRSARQAVRERIATARRWAERRPDPAVIEANRRHFERKRRAHAERLARMRRILIHAFPARQPEAVVLVDVGRREIATLMSEEIAEAKEKLADYDIIAAVEVRKLLRALHFEPGGRQLAELGPPQKTRQLNRRGRKLRITTSLLVQGSCGISLPRQAACGQRHATRSGSTGVGRIGQNAASRSSHSPGITIRWRSSPCSRVPTFPARPPARLSRRETSSRHTRSSSGWPARRRRPWMRLDSSGSSRRWERRARIPSGPCTMHSPRHSRSSNLAGSSPIASGSPSTRSTWRTRSMQSQ